MGTGFRVCLKLAAYHMERLYELDGKKSYATLRLHKVAGHMTEILELHAERPSFHILFIPGNPGIVSFYKDYLEILYELLDQKASVTGLGGWKIILIARANSPQGRIYKRGIATTRSTNIAVQVSYMIGMYPFLTLNRESKWQSLLTKLAKLWIICEGVSYFAGLVGLSPAWFHRGIIKSLLGHSLSSDAVHIACTYLLRYSMVRNFTFMGMTEFEKLQENPDWTFIRGKENQIAFLFGSNDHWGPLSLFEEVSKKASGVNLTIEKEGHTHAFCCTKAGSAWVANHTVDLIKQHLQCVY